jgi:hypothetical protein
MLRGDACIFPKRFASVKILAHQVCGHLIEIATPSPHHRYKRYSRPRFPTSFQPKASATRIVICRMRKQEKVHLIDTRWAQEYCSQRL